MKKTLLFLIATLLSASSAFGSFSPNKGYNEQTTGTNSGTWGIVLNSNLTTIDSNLGGTLNINVAGNSNVTLTTAQSAFLMHKLTGALTGNINYTFPAGGVYQINNATTGAFTITVKMAGGTGVTIPQGAVRTVFVDASNLTAQVDSVAGSTLASANILVGNASNVASAVPLSGDCGLSNIGNITCLFTNGTLFTSAATTAIGTSGATIPLLNGTNTWNGTNGFGSVTATTPAITDSSTKVATTAFVKTAPTTTILTSGSGTYTTPSGVLWLEVRLVGGGGAGGGTPGGNGTSGTNTVFGSVTANAGGFGNGGTGSNVTTVAGGLGGVSGTGTATLRFAGQNGSASTMINTSYATILGVSGGSSFFGGGGSAFGNSNGNPAQANTGSGGGGAADLAGNGNTSGAGGGAGEYAEIMITSPASTYSYTVGAGGIGGVGSLSTGGNGAAGIIEIIEHYTG